MWDLTGGRTSTSEYHSPYLQSGKLFLKIKFNKPLGKELVLITGQTYPSTITVDKNRTVNFTYMTTS